ncbi:MAG: DUF1559 domain-containing protein [Planctomycetota bacterium]
MRSQPRSASSRAFTLIELLVVISIIALLISILLPTLSAARSTARAVQCGTNLKQIGIAQFAYEADTTWMAPAGVGTVGGAADGAYSPTAGVNFKNWWYQLLRGYLGRENSAANLNAAQTQEFTAEGALLCPETELVDDETRSYAMNSFHWLGGTGPAWFNTTVKPLEQRAFEAGAGNFAVRSEAIGSSRDQDRISPVNTVLASDQTIFPTGTALYRLIHNPDFQETSGGYSNAVATGGQTAFRHSDARTILFLDGHVNAKKADEEINRGLTFDSP